MLKYLLVIICFLQVNQVILYCQSIPLEVVASSGNSSSDSPQLDWTLGEVMVTSFTSSNQLSQGLHQGAITITDVEVIDESIEIDVYPNPVITSIHVKHGSKGKLKYEIRNVQGQKIITNTLNDEGQIDFSDMNVGNYFLSFYNNNKLIKTAKIIKIY